MRLKTGGTKRLNVVLHNQDYSSLLAGGQVIAARNVCRRVVFHMVEIPKIDMQFDIGFFRLLLGVLSGDLFFFR